jgi:tetratricopeptide (TPR) repeat protein
MLQAARSAEKLQRFTDAAEMYERFLDQELDPQVALDYHYMLKRQGKSQASEVLLLSLLAKPGISASTEHEVRYELSQLYRAAGRNQEYEAQLRALVRDTDEARFWRELADELYGSGRHEMAAEAFAKSIAEGQPPAESARTARVIAGIHLTLEDPATAADWLAKSKAWVPPDDDWRLLKARSDYHLGNFGAAAATLLNIEQKSDVTFFYIGFAYYRDGKSGLAYHYLAKVSDDQNLPVNSRKLLLANRAFLAFDQGRFEEAMEDARMAIALEPSGSLELLQLKALMELERYEEAHARSIEFLRRSPLSRLLTEDAAEPLETVEVAEPAGTGLRAFELFEEQDHWLETPANLSAVAQIAAVSAFRLGDTDLAIHLMSGAIEVEPTRHAPRYLRALGYHSRGDYQLALDDFQACLELDPDPRVSFWRDYAVTMGRLRRYREGTEALGRVLPLYPCSIDDLEETGYQYMTWGHNADSREHFAKAIDLYSEVLPYLDDDEALEYRRGRLAMKREYTKLDKTIGLQAYFTRTDYDLEGPVPTPSIDGALPSQTGVELSWRPPVIGFHNERLFEVFGRLLSNFEDDSWKFDEESYQGGVGIRGKPFKRLNLGVSFERLFKIGDDSEDNWLLRLLGGRAWGEFHEERFALGTAGQLYGDVGAFLDDPERWYYYLDGRVGLSVGAGSRVALTIPQLLMVRRWEEDSESGIDNYWLAGVGLTGRLFGGERRYTSGRWYIDTYLHYTWGRFDEVPAGLTEDERDFEGVVLGINFIK